MSQKRRQHIVEIARRHDLAIVENDVLGPLVKGGGPPIAALAPERTLYVTSFTKIVVPGLRIGYLAAPDRYVAAVASRHLVANWMATPIVAEIATKWVEDGTAIELVDWQRQMIGKRHEIAAAILDGAGFRSHPQSLHVWLPLPANRQEDAFVAQARLRGVAIAPGASFRIALGQGDPAVRISLGSTDEDELRNGLGVVVALLAAGPEHLLLAI